MKRFTKKHIHLFKSITVLSLGVSLIFSSLGGSSSQVHEVNAQGDEYIEVDGYANQWARSDLRAWLNGLTKTDNNLPVDGSNGTKSSDNFLNCFTDAELALFEPQTVTTNVFNDSAVLNSSDDDKALTRTTSSVQTKDRFWAASGLHMRNHANAYEDQLISADPGYDLSDYYTYKQKVKNGKVNKWKNIIPIPFWSGSGAFYDYMLLRSASYEDTAQALGSDSGYNIEEHDVDDSWTSSAACGCITLPSDVFAAMAESGEVSDGNFLKKEIAAYAKLGKKNYSGSAPFFGMYLKKITLDNIAGCLTYNSGAHTLTFETDQPLPSNKHLMVQVYKNWDWSKETEDDGTPPEVQNARIGDTVFIAEKKIVDNNVTSETFTFTGNNISDLTGYTVKVWIEQEATNDSLAQVSNPLTFSIGANGAANPIEETKSLNPRVFAYKSDLACSWGVYNTEAECTFISHGETIFNEYRNYVGIGATFQKLYIGTAGTGNNCTPIEWWIAGRDGDILTLYQYSGTEYKLFNGSTSGYEGTVRNPSLYLKNDFTNEDIKAFTSKVTLSKVAIEQDDPSDCDGEITTDPIYNNDFSADNILVVSADNLSLQFCKSNGSEWTDAPDGAGTYYVRAAFAGETINSVKYAPCFSNVRKIEVPEPPVYVTGVEIKKGQSSTTKETIYSDEILTLCSNVSPEDAYDTKVKWSVSSGDDKIKLYKDEDCSTELDSTTEVTGGTTVYAKALGEAGDAAITVTTVGLDSEGQAKTSTCDVKISYKPTGKFTATIEEDTLVYCGGCQVPEVTVTDGKIPLDEGTDYELSYKRIEKDVSTAIEQAQIIEVGSYKAIVTGLGDYKDNKAELEFAIETDKSDWGLKKENSGIENYVTEKGVTSAEIRSDNSDSNGIIWLKEEADGVSAWYGIDNSAGTFRQGSRVWVRWLGKEADNDKFQNYLNMLDDSHKQAVENDRLWIFMVGVTDPDGNEYTNLNGDVNFYVELGEDWDKDDINGVFISNQKDEVVSTDCNYDFKYPEGTSTVAGMRIRHFSPYAIYDKSDDNKGTTETDKSNNNNSTKEKNNTSTDKDKTVQKAKDIEKSIKNLKNENDLKGSTYAKLKVKGTAKSNTSIKLSWKKVKGAKKYIIYGNRCGKKNKYKKIKTVKGTSYTAKKLKKGTYYKYIVVAVKGDEALATSKTIHVTTNGGKYGNNTKVKLSNKKLTLKKGKSKKIKATLKSGKKKVSIHRKVAWESDNKAVAKVSKSGKITAVGKGTCYIYAYAQNGVMARVKVTVK